MAVKFSAFTTRTGTLDASTRIVGYDDPAGTKTNVEFTLATLVANSGIYGADGTIGASRVATITDFPKFSGTQGNPIGLELENTQTGSGALTTLGAQLKLTSNSATATIGYFNGGGGGTSAPALVLDSPARVVYEAGADTGYQFLFTQGSPRGQFKLINELDAGKYIPIFESIVGGGGSNYSELRLAKTGTTYTYIRSVHNDANNICSLGRTVSGTYGEAIRINQANQLGINSDGLTISETLHVNGNARIDGQAYTEQHGAPLAGATIDWDNSNVQYIQLASGANTLSLSNPKSGATYILQVKQPSSGAAGTITYPASVKYPGGTKPVLTTDNDAIDIITLIYNGTTTHYYASATLDLK
jgi:hypothetical protein